MIQSGEKLFEIWKFHLFVSLSYLQDLMHWVMNVFFFKNFKQKKNFTVNATGFEQKEPKYVLKIFSNLRFSNRYLQEILQVFGLPLDLNVKVFLRKRRDLLILEKCCCCNRCEIFGPGLMTWGMSVISSPLPYYISSVH